jgi:hypothetical protein
MGRSTGFSVSGETPEAAEAICFLRSAISRWKAANCLEYSSRTVSKSARSFLCFPSRASVRKGVITNSIRNRMTNSATMGLGRPWQCLFLCSDGRTAATENLALCFPSGPASKQGWDNLLRTRNLADSSPTHGKIRGC